MQAWALQQVLKKMGHEPVTIDRQPDARGMAYRSARIVYRALRKALGKGKSPVFPEHVIPIVTKHTRDFIRANLTMSPMIDSTQKLSAHFIEEGYEAVIVGSDQTWRPAYSPNLYNFFLDFIPDRTIKRIAYASSFGVDHWEFSSEQTTKCMALAREFDFISVRETSGVNLCADHLGVEAKTVLDPTLLLKADDYSALIGHQGPEERSDAGVYTYLLDETPLKTLLTHKVSAELGFPVFKHQAERSLSNWSGGLLDQYLMPPVPNWLSGFRQAAFVVTDSFHGVVFSILFGKPFLAISNSERGAARFKSLLSQLNLIDRLIYDDRTPDSHSLSAPLPRSYVASLSTLRNQSTSTLERILS